MKAEDYQKLAARTINGNPVIDPKYGMLLNSAMGLSGETGELVDYLKKVVFHGHELDVETVKKEIGDIQWYVAAICTSLDISLKDVMESNIEKLRKRYPDGFNSEDSKNRVDVD